PERVSAGMYSPSALAGSSSSTSSCPPVAGLGSGAGAGDARATSSRPTSLEGRSLEGAGSVVVTSSLSSLVGADRTIVAMLSKAWTCEVAPLLDTTVSSLAPENGACSRRRQSSSSSGSSGPQGCQG